MFPMNNVLILNVVFAQMGKCFRLWLTKIQQSDWSVTGKDLRFPIYVYKTFPLRILHVTFVYLYFLINVHFVNPIFKAFLK